MRFLKVFSMEGSSRPIDQSSLSIERMNVYRRYQDELKAIAHWTEYADRDLFMVLRRIAKVINEIDPPSITPTVLYRGFNPGSFQENFGMQGQIKEGLEGVFTHPGKLISCSTNIDIAKMFGTDITSFEQNLSRVSCLRLTDEIMQLVCDIRGEEPVSQDEVILMPPVSLQWKVVQAG